MAAARSAPTPVLCFLYCNEGYIKLALARILEWTSWEETVGHDERAALGVSWLPTGLLSYAGQELTILQLRLLSSRIDGFVLWKRKRTGAQAELEEQ